MVVAVHGGSITPDEQKIYVDYITEKFPKFDITELIITLEEDERTHEEMVKLEYHYTNKPEFNVPFERIRRITGYLVGGMNRWNDAKREEEHDRVKHGTSTIEEAVDKISKE